MSYLQSVARRRNWTKALLSSAAAHLNACQGIVGISREDQARLASACDLVKLVLCDWDNKTKECLLAIKQRIPF